MLDPKINDPHPDAARVRLDVSSVDAMGRQRRDPNTRKDFKKLINRNEAEEGELGEDEPPAKFGQSKESKTPGSSIFEMRGGPGPGAAAEANAQQGQTVEFSSTPKSSKFEKKQKSSSYTEARGDLSILDSNRPVEPQLIQRRSFDINAGASEGETSTVPSLQQIVDQIVDSIYTLKTDGKTETVLMLKHPPELAGAEVVLTGFSHARGEFNIAIHNLTQAAQLFLEQNNVRVGLKQALEERGYTVHVVTATTEPFKIVATDGSEGAKKDRQDREDEKDQERNRQNR